MPSYRLIIVDREATFRNQLRQTLLACGCLVVGETGDGVRTIPWRVN